MALRDTATRLAELEHILATTASTSGGGEPGAVDVHLQSVPAERIRRLTAVLAARDSEDVDPVDALTMRLLLGEYAAAVSHLRAVAQIAASRVDAAPAPIREGRRVLHRLTKTAAAPGAATDAARS